MVSSHWGPKSARTEGREAEEMQLLTAAFRDSLVGEEWMTRPPGLGVGGGGGIILFVYRWQLEVFWSSFSLLGHYLKSCLDSGLLLLKRKRNQKELCWILFHIVCLFSLFTWSSFLFLSLFSFYTLFSDVSKLCLSDPLWWLNACETLRAPLWFFFQEVSPFWKWFSSVIWIFCSIPLPPELLIQKLSPPDDTLFLHSLTIGESEC